MLGNCYFYVKSIVIFTNMKYNKHICISVEGIIPFDNMDLTNSSIFRKKFDRLSFSGLSKHLKTDLTLK